MSQLRSRANYSFQAIRINNTLRKLDTVAEYTAQNILINQDNGSVRHYGIFR